MWLWKTEGGNRMETSIYAIIPLQQYRGEIMPIPPLNSDGYLPPGIVDCTLEEINQSFGTNERRKELIGKLCQYIQKIQEIGLSGLMIINGSFATSKEEPGDIDAILVLGEEYSISKPLTSSEKLFTAWGRVKENFEMDLIVVFPDGGSQEGWVNLFSGVKENSSIQKGLLRIAI